MYCTYVNTCVNQYTDLHGLCYIIDIRILYDIYISLQDAYWVLPGNTLKCSSPADVYLLLKSSDFIHHDLSRV